MLTIQVKYNLINKFQRDTYNSFIMIRRQKLLIYDKLLLCNDYMFDVNVTCTSNMHIESITCIENEVSFMYRFQIKCNHSVQKLYMYVQIQYATRNNKTFLAFRLLVFIILIFHAIFKWLHFGNTV